MKEFDPPNPGDEAGHESERTEAPAETGTIEDQSAEAQEAPPVNRDAWENPGSFEYTQDQHGRVTRIEGWLGLRDEQRSPADTALQRETTQEAGANPDQDAAHLIAHSLGGPTTEQHGSETARANLVVADSRVNRSYMAGL